MATSRKKPNSLSHGRPRAVVKPPSSLSSRATRNLIQTHHRLHKARAAAHARGDEAKVTKLEEAIEEQGGLESYQVASITGQSASRGGDSSRLLVSWLEPWKLSTVGMAGDHMKSTEPLKMLEVGALSTSNACSTCGLFSVTRIDLHSQAPGIETQDFMERPLPASEPERFDMISLSLVLNYVPDASGRGNMLKRTCEFLARSRCHSEEISGSGNDTSGVVFPALFLVLPAPCVTNSRYLNQKRLEEIMQSLGYTLLEAKLSSKLAYSLWRWSGSVHRLKTFSKVEVNPGKSRNNFAIIIT